MFELFTDDARGMVVRSQRHASELRDSYVGTAHLLLALTDDEASPVAQAITSLNVSVPELRAHLSESYPSEVEPPTGYIPMTPRSKMTLQNSWTESVRHHRSDIDVADLGMAIALIDGGAAARTLAHFGLTRAQLHAQINQLRPPARPPSTDTAASAPERRRGHRPRDATTLHPDQLAIVPVTFIDDYENQALIGLPNGSQTSVQYGFLAFPPGERPIGSEIFTYGIRVKFVGDQDGKALVRLPDDARIAVEYTDLTVTDEPEIKPNPDGSLTVSCPNCEWSQTQELASGGFSGAVEAFETHHAEQHSERFL